MCLPAGSVTGRLPLRQPRTLLSESVLLRVGAGALRLTGARTRTLRVGALSLRKPVALPRFL